MARFETLEDTVNFAKSAFETNNISALISGEGEWAVHTSRYDSVAVPNDIPTDFSYVLDVCIYDYYRETMDSTIPQKFKSALIRMLNTGDPKNIWCSYSMLWEQCVNEAEGNAAFSIIDDNLIRITRNALISNKSGLENCFVWLGKKRGLWSDIEKSDAYLRDKYGRNFL